MVSLGDIEDNKPNLKNVNKGLTVKWKTKNKDNLKGELKLKYCIIHGAGHYNK